jgi:hypothetical protein
MKSLIKILRLVSILIIIFCVSFFLFYKITQKDSQPLILTQSVINQPLPKAHLVDVSGNQLDDDKLRRGKVILIFSTLDCKYCDEENDFLKTEVGKRQDVNFYYVIPFGPKDKQLREAQNKYAFAAYYDDGSRLSRSLQLLQVPIMVYLEDGVIKKTWIDSIAYNHREDEFNNWLSRL